MRRRPGRPCSLRPPNSCAKAITCAIFGVPSVPTPLGVTPCWSAFSCTSKLPASLQRDWPRCCDCRTVRQTHPSPGKLWRLEWHPSRCRPGTYVRLPDDRAFFWASRQCQTSISQDPATVSAGSSSASSESLVRDLDKTGPVVRAAVNFSAPSNSLRTAHCQSTHSSGHGLWYPKACLRPTRIYPEQ